MSTNILRRLVPVLFAAALLPGALFSTTAGALAGPGQVSLTHMYHAAPVPLPANIKSTSLAFLYHQVGLHNVTDAILDTSQDVVFFTIANKEYATSFVDSTAGQLQAFLVHAGVNVTVGTLAATASGSSSTIKKLLDILFVLSLAVAAFSLIFYRHFKRKKERVPLTEDSGDTATLAAKGPGATHGDLLQVRLPTTRFADVAGCPEAVASMREFVEFLTVPEQFEKVGAVIPNGALLVGPPGTGKTMLARALAGEAGVAFFATSGASFNEIYVGTGAKRVRELFARARKAAPSIIFIDEIDAIAKQRSSHPNAGESERESTLTSLLTAMDGFRDSHVIVIAATNRPDVLDSAITRPGRLDRRIEVPLPDKRGREQIIRAHFGTRPIDPDYDPAALAAATSGMSGADLAAVVNEACIETARDRESVVTTKHFDTAVATVAMGRARTSALISPDDRLITAWHEAGHTVCAYVQKAADQPRSVTIIPRGAAGGVTWMSEGEDKFLRRSKASARLVTGLAGRAAEELLLLDDYTQGAASDLQAATRLAHTMVTQYGMTGSGLVFRDPELFGEGSSEGVVTAVGELLTQALHSARALLTQHLPFVEALVAALLEKETLGAAEIADIARQFDHLPATMPREIFTTTDHSVGTRTPLRVATLLESSPHHRERTSAPAGTTATEELVGAAAITPPANQKTPRTRKIKKQKKEKKTGVLPDL